MGRFSRLRAKATEKLSSAKSRTERRLKKAVWKRLKKYFKLYVELRILRAATDKIWRKISRRQKK